VLADGLKNKSRRRNPVTLYESSPIYLLGITLSIFEQQFSVVTMK